MNFQARINDYLVRLVYVNAREAKYHRRCHRDHYHPRRITIVIDIGNIVMGIG